MEFFAADKKDSVRLKKAVDNIVNYYNEVIGKGMEIASSFSNLRKKAISKGYGDAIVITKIGKKLSKGILPEIEQVEKVANFIDKIV